MKNKIKKFLSVCILVPTLIFSPVQTQAFAITATVTLGMFVNFLVSTVIVGGVIYEFTNGTPDLPYTEIKNTLNQKDTSLYKYNNASLLSVKSATDLVTLGLTPLEAKTITDAYDEYCEYYETVSDTEPYTFKNSSVFTSTVSLAKSLNYVVPSYQYTSLTPSIVINESNFYDYGLTYENYQAITNWSQVYYYVFLGAYIGTTTQFNDSMYSQIANGSIDFKPCVLYSNAPIVFYKNGEYTYLHTLASTPSVYSLGYQSNGNLYSAYDFNIRGLKSMSSAVNDTTSYQYSYITFTPPSSSSAMSNNRYLLATNDEAYASSYSAIPVDIISKNLISIGNNDLPVVNKVVGAESSVIDITIPYKTVDTVTVLPGAIALSPSSVDEYKNSIVADESFSLTLPVEDVVTPPVTVPEDWSWWSWLADWCSEFWTSFTNALERVFVPSATYFDTYFDDVKEEADRKLPIINDLGTFFNSISNVDYISKCPRFTITLPSSWGGGTHDIIDFSLYNDYRSYVLLFFRGILWFTFLRKLYKKLPDVVY